MVGATRPPGKAAGARSRRSTRLGSIGARTARTNRTHAPPSERPADAGADAPGSQAPLPKRLSAHMQRGVKDCPFTGARAQPRQHIATAAGGLLRCRARSMPPPCPALPSSSHHHLERHGHYLLQGVNHSALWGQGWGWGGRSKRTYEMGGWAATHARTWRWAGRQALQGPPADPPPPTSGSSLEMNSVSENCCASFWASAGSHARAAGSTERLAGASHGLAGAAVLPAPPHWPVAPPPGALLTRGAVGVHLRILLVHGLADGGACLHAQVRVRQHLQIVRLLRMCGGGGGQGEST